MSVDNGMSAKRAKLVRPIGVWDLTVSPITLGGLLTLLEELKIWSEIHKSNAVDVCVVGDPTSLVLLSHLPTDKHWISLTDNSACKESGLLAMLLGMEGVETCYLFTSGADLQCFLHQAPYEYIPWPALTPQGSVYHQYGYTLFVQKYYRENRCIPFLSCKAEPLRWALEFIRNYVASSIPVVAHLKNKLRSSGKPDWYNARFDEWDLFFQSICSRYDVKFLLIGNEPVPAEIRALPNVIVTQDLGSDLLKDLALVQIAYAFMGVASGPSQMAIFSETPYVIYKNPEYHVQRMMKEMGTSDRFVFATSFQKLLRRFETCDSLLQEFERIYASNPRKQWENRLKRW